MVGDWIIIGGIFAAEMDLDGPFVRPSGQNGVRVFRGSTGKNICWQEYWGGRWQATISLPLAVLAAGSRNIVAK
jgi:hypothetical protein